MNIKKLTLAGMLSALGVVCSTFYIPIGIAKCFPIQHLINVVCAILLGPFYGVLCAFTTSLIRNLLGTGTPLAFLGSMIGALIAGIAYQKTKKIYAAALGEIFGTGIIGSLLCYPFARLFLGNQTAVWYTFVLPFFASTVCGSVIAIVLLTSQSKIMQMLKQKGLQN
jgi:energy coupling factor transporter S component ThiW